MEMLKKNKIISLLLVFILSGCLSTSTSSFDDIEAYYSIVNYKETDFFVLYIQSKSISSFANISIDDSKLNDYFKEADNMNGYSLDDLSFSQKKDNWYHTIFVSQITLMKEVATIKTDLSYIEFSCDDVETYKTYYLNAAYEDMINETSEE